jgi:hypothetical protein
MITSWSFAHSLILLGFSVRGDQKQQAENTVMVSDAQGGYP